MTIFYNEITQLELFRSLHYNPTAPPVIIVSCSEEYFMILFDPSKFCQVFIKWKITIVGWLWQAGADRTTQELSTSPVLLGSYLQLISNRSDYTSHNVTLRQNQSHLPVCFTYLDANTPLDLVLFCISFSKLQVAD